MFEEFTDFDLSIDDVLADESVGTQLLTDLKESTNNVHELTEGSDTSGQRTTTTVVSKNAERCRKHREKKREEEKKLYLENNSLKRERSEMLKQISDLEFEVQALRGQGAVDLSKENELLRAEIKLPQKYRSYIQRVVDIAHETADTTQEENTRLMKQGIESGIGQIIGLCYSSIFDDTWKEGMSFNLVLSDQKGLSTEVKVKYQFLPLGSGTADAKRMNIRFDLLSVPLACDSIMAYYKKFSRNFQDLKKNFDMLKTGERIDIAEVLPFTKVGDDEEVSCTSLTVTKADGTKKEGIFASSQKRMNVYNSAFLPETHAYGENSLEPVKLHVATSCNVETDTKDCSRIQEITTKGFLLREVEPGLCCITCMGSIPRVGGLYDFGIQDEEFVGDDGVIGDIYMNLVQMQWQTIYENCKEREESSKS